MDDLLSSLDEEQLAAAEALHGPLVILAGAGSGKTRTVTHRIAHGVATGVFDPRRTMALTFTTSAAAELGRRLESLETGPVATRTFHSAALRQLRYFWPDAIGGAIARIAPSKRPLVSEALTSCGESANQAVVRSVAAEIEWCKSANLTADSYRGRPEGPPLDPAIFAKAFRTYEDVKSRHGVIDFEDVLLITIGLLESRSDIREEVRRTYRWFTVDEFQDVSPLQMRLLNLWLGRSTDVCVVGDPAQSIYRFAGADSDLLTGFSQQFPDAQVVRLHRSYRCDAPIVDAANRVASQIPQALTLASVSAGDPSAVQVLSFPDEESEARGVAEEIAALLRNGRPPSAIACLYRTHAQSIALQAGLQQADVDYCSRGSDRFFDRPEVREALTRLRGGARVASPGSARDAVEEVMTAMGVTSTSGSATERDRMESLRALLGLAQEFDSVKELIADLDRRESTRLAPPPNAVTLMTLHAAKGLEWSTVFITGTVEGLLPLATERGPADLDEERRLFYVGVTRAAHRLVITWPRHRARGGAASSLSRFVTDMKGANIESVGRPSMVSTGITVRERTPATDPISPAPCTACGKGLVTGKERVLGRCLGCPSLANTAVLEALEQWRSRVCEQTLLPRHAVLTDASLERVATGLPVSSAQLAELPGLNSQKVAAYGQDLLDVIESQRAHQATDRAANPVDRPREPPD